MRERQRGNQTRENFLKNTTKATSSLSSLHGSVSRQNEKMREKRRPSTTTKDAGTYPTTACQQLLLSSHGWMVVSIFLKFKILEDGETMLPKRKGCHPETPPNYCFEMGSWSQMAAHFRLQDGRSLLGGTVLR